MLSVPISALLQQPEQLCACLGCLLLWSPSRLDNAFSVRQAIKARLQPVPQSFVPASRVACAQANILAFHPASLRDHLTPLVKVLAAVCSIQCLLLGAVPPVLVPVHYLGFSGKCLSPELVVRSHHTHPVSLVATTVALQ